MRPRIGVLTSGGDCPGLNAVLRGVVLAAEKLGWEVVGFRDGFEGLLPPGNHVIVDRQSVNGIMALGGTIIGTTNRGHFVAKIGAGDRTIVPENIIAGAKKILDELQVRALIIVGGDGSMVTAQQLQEAGINCIGVPKTIDNDLEATATTFGFDSAVAVVMDALDRVHTTATSHRRVMVVEVMGRHTGWIALHGGIAGGADIILIPEIPFDFDKIASVVSPIPHSAATIIPFDVQNRLHVLQQRQAERDGKAPASLTPIPGPPQNGEQQHLKAAAAATPPAAAATPAEERPEPLPGAGSYDRPIPPPDVTPIGSISQPGKFTVEGRVRVVEIRSVERNSVLACEICDSTGDLTALFYGRSRIAGLMCGSRVRFRGQVGIKGGAPVMVNPAYELIVPHVAGGPG